MMETLLKEIDNILKTKNERIEFLEWQNKNIASENRELNQEIRELRKKVEELKKEENEDE